MKIINGFTMVALTYLMLTLGGCSQDNESYDSDMYTMAEPLETRAAETNGEQDKKKVVISPIPIGFSDPTDIGDNTLCLYGEYDGTTLSIMISGYSGNIQISVLSVLGHHLMDYSENAVASNAQLDFPLSNYTKGKKYQIYITLDNGDAYCGEFSL